MKFLDYKNKKKLTLDEMSKMFEVSIATVHNWISGKTRPRRRKAMEIMKLTKGEICPKDLM